MSISVIDVRNKGEKIEDLPPETAVFFISAEKCTVLNDLGRFGTILYDFVRFGTIDML